MASFVFPASGLGRAAVKVIRVVPCGRVRVERFRLVRQGECAMRRARPLLDGPRLPIQLGQG